MNKPWLVTDKRRSFHQFLKFVKAFWSLTNPLHQMKVHGLNEFILKTCTAVAAMNKLKNTLKCNKEPLATSQMKQVSTSLQKYCMTVVKYHPTTPKQITNH